MEGTIPGNRVDQFRARLKEGSVYTIEKFNLYDAKKSYRAVDHPLRICFTQRTVVNEVLPQPEGFPIFAYSAFPFVVLTGRVDQNVLMSGKFVCTFSFSNTWLAIDCRTAVCLILCTLCRCCRIDH